jgi:hypothetical protein
MTRRPPPVDGHSAVWTQDFATWELLIRRWPLNCRYRVPFPGLPVTIAEAGAARGDRLVRIAAGRARWSEAAWLLRMTGCAAARRVIGMGACQRICQRDPAGRAWAGETSRDRRRWPARVGQGQDGPSETARDGGDRGRMSHKPEVAGSNPAPATKTQFRGPFRAWKGPLVCRILTGSWSTPPRLRPGRSSRL